jgi:hypothetical protein
VDEFRALCDLERQDAEERRDDHTYEAGQFWRA